jgi:hypothetical protein
MKVYKVMEVKHILKYCKLQYTMKVYKMMEVKHILKYCKWVELTRHH